MKKLIKNLRIVDGGKVTDGSLLIEDGKILAAGTVGEIPEGTETVDGKNLYASAGFIEVHSHGAGGCDFMDGTQEAYLTACRTHLSHGTTTIFPTTLAASLDELRQSIRTFNGAKEELNSIQFVPGLHLEGPYFALKMCGGQDPRYIHDPVPEEYIPMVEESDGAIARWSIAPELSGAMEMGDYLSDRGILPSIAHTDATYADVKEAIRHGYTHVTHLYSCTSSIIRKSGFRILGVTESAYCFDDLTVEIIADGCHLPPELIAMIVKCKGVDKITLVTDSLRAAGQNVKTTKIGSLTDGRECPIEDGVVKLPDRSAFAGSCATADRLIRTVWKMAGVPLTDAVRMMTENPAKLMHIDGRKGRLLPGKDADIVLFDENVTVDSVYYMGQKVL